MVNWNSIQIFANTEDHKQMLQKIAGIYPPRIINFLLEQVDALAAPETVKDLEKLQKRHESIGGGFFGLVPPIIGEDDIIPVPRDNATILEFLVFCAEKYETGLKTVEMADYQPRFQNTPFPDLKPSQLGQDHGTIDLSIDLSFLEQIVEYLSSPEKKEQLIDKIVANPILEELINHRNGLGYVPGPVFTPDFYRQFLEMAHSQDPLESIWKTLHPWNYFDLADIWQNIEGYSLLIDEFKKSKSKIEEYSQSLLAPLIPAGKTITEDVAFSAEWAIKGWASKRYAGISIEYYKDDYMGIIDTLVHEVFHRVQLKILPKPVEIGDSDLDFDLLFKFEDLPWHQLMVYKALSYVFLEGSATALVRTPNTPFSTEEIESASKGLDILEEIRSKTQANKDLSQEEAKPLVEEIQGLLNQGLRSNGSFYSLGEYISLCIIKKHGKIILRDILIQGIHHFYELYLQLDSIEHEELALPAPLRDMVDKNREDVASYL